MCKINVNVWSNLKKKKKVGWRKRAGGGNGTIVSNILYYKLSSGLYCVLKISIVGCSIPKTLAVQTLGGSILRHTHTYTLTLWAPTT